MYILIVTILILLFGLYAYTTIEALVKRRYKKFLLMTLSPIVLLTLAIVWFLTTIPYDIGIKRTPVLEFIKIRKAVGTEISTCLYNSDLPAYMIECASDMRLETWRPGYPYLFCSHKLSDFSYGDIVESLDEELEREEAVFIKEENGKFIYYVPFQLQTNPDDYGKRKTIRMSDIKQDLHGRIFCISGFPEPVVGTSEMIIPLDSLKKAVEEETIIDRETIAERIENEQYQAEILRETEENQYRAISDFAEVLFCKDNITRHPDSLYQSQYPAMDNCFRGEAGQDLYDAWYAYYLLKANQEKQFETEQKEVSRIFFCVNEALCTVSGGGNGFGHEVYRIPAYAGYYVCQYKEQTSHHDPKIDAEHREEAMDAMWQLISMYKEDDVPLRTLAERLEYVNAVTDYLRSLIKKPIHLYCLQNYMASYVNRTTNE